MKIICFSSALVAASLVIAPTVASAATAAGTQPAGQMKAAAEKKICKQLPSSMSRLPQKSCLTAKQWKELQDAE
jgi:hypothetical protein